jgi:hypothetical protein
MTKLHLKYVQSFGGYHYFRRRGSPRIPLPGIVGSAEFMEAYQRAHAAAPVAIGASQRSKPGSSPPPLPSITARRHSGVSQAARQHRAGPSLKNSVTGTATFRWHHCRRNSSLH